MKNKSDSDSDSDSEIEYIEENYENENVIFKKEIPV
jgi:hypothetical protein